MVWRNPLGCLSTFGLVVTAIVLLASAEHLPSAGKIIPWGLAVAGLAVVLVNVRWRSMRVKLIYSLCLACRARRGRWIGYWTLAFLVAGGLAFLVHPATALLLLPMYVLASRLQPVALRPAKVQGDKVWVRGVSAKVRERFPPLEAVDTLTG